MGEAVFREIIRKLHALVNTKSVSDMQQVHTNMDLDGLPSVDYQFGMSMLRDLRERKSLSQAKLASLAGTSQPQIKRLEDGSRELTVAWAERLAPHLGVTAEQLLFPNLAQTAGRQGGVEPNVDLSKAEPAPPLHRFGGPRDVPVLGTAVGGGNDDGDFRFNGETIDYAPRPPGIASRKDVYVLYVENDSMSPRFEPGERLYVDPHRAPRAMDYVVVELHGEGGEPGKGFIKRLVKKTPTKLVVSQFNPAKELEFDASRVKQLHRVIPYDELLGI
jgi:phage repressor protein C with HTH and peptisase S24 domain